MKTNTLECIFSDYKKSKANKSGRLNKNERKNVKLARNTRKNKNAIYAEA